MFSTRNLLSLAVLVHSVTSQASSPAMQQVLNDGPGDLLNDETALDNDNLETMDILENPLENLGAPVDIQSNVDELSNGDVGGPINEDVGEPTAEEVNALTAEDAGEVPVLPAEEVDELSNEDVGEPTAEEVNALNAEDVGEVPVPPAEEVDELSNEDAGELTAEDMGEPTADEVDELTADEVDELTADEVDELTAEDAKMVLPEVQPEGEKSLGTETAAIDTAGTPVDDEETAEDVGEVPVPPAEEVDELSNEDAGELTAEDMGEPTADEVDELTAEDAKMILPEVQPEGEKSLGTETAAIDTAGTPVDNEETDIDAGEVPVLPAAEDVDEESAESLDPSLWGVVYSEM